MWLKIGVTATNPQGIPFPIIVVDIDGSNEVYDSTAWLYRVNSGTSHISIYMNLDTSYWRLVNVYVDGTGATYTQTSDGSYNTKLDITLGTALEENSEHIVSLGLDRIASKISYVTPLGTTPTPTLVDDVPGNLTNANLPTMSVANNTFLGWYFDPNFDTQAQVGDRIDEDTILYAKWGVKKLIFNTNGGSDIPDYFGNTIPTLSGSYIPSKEKYGFSGWYQDPSFTTSATSGTLIQNLASYNASTLTATIYAKWYTFTITYNSNSGSAISSDYGTKLPLSLPIPTRVNYEFVGWYYDASFTMLARGGDDIINNVTLYAKWTQISTEPMDIILYRNSAEKERVNKASFLTLVGTISGRLRKASSLLNPVIDIEYDTIDFNYVYIPLFNRYYYVTEIITLVSGMWEIRLKVDVLYSFKTEIYNLSAYVDRQQTDYNQELVDNEVIAKNSTTYDYENLGRDSRFGSDKVNTNSYSFVLGGMK